MATKRPKYHRLDRQQKSTTSKRSFDEDQSVNVTCRCRVCKRTLCRYCKKSPKRFKLKDKRTVYLSDKPEAVSVPSDVTEVGGSRSGSQYWDVNFSEYFSKTFKEVLQIKPRGGCFTIRYFKEKIWASKGNNRVEVYNTTGTNLKTFDINSPKSVAIAINGDIFFACYFNCGLYVMDDTEALHKICDGSFADVYTYRDKVYALEYQKKLIMEFCCRLDTADVRQRWRNENEWKVGEAMVDDKLIVTGDEYLQLYVSHRNSHKICLYNTQGQCIKQFGSRQETGYGKLYWPRLCGVDRQSHLLVADQGNNVYKILDPVTGQWRSTGVRGKRHVYDAALDQEGNLWLSQDNGWEYIITNNEPQRFVTYKF